MQELNEKQIQKYNSYRATGMTPEKALSLATKGSDNQYNPALDVGVDNILFGKGSFTSAVGTGLKEAFIEGPKAIADDASKYGGVYAALKSPLTLAAGAGRGVGAIVGGALETADDLTGEFVSQFTMPAAEAAMNSDVGKYLVNKSIELDQKGRGIPGDILDTLNLLELGIPSLLKSAPAKTIKQTIATTAKETVETGAAKAQSMTGGLADFLGIGKKVDVPENPIEDSLLNIENILKEKLDNPSIVQSINEIKTAMIANDGSFTDSVIAKLDEILAGKDVTPEERASLETYIRNIDGVLSDTNSSSLVDDFLSKTTGKVDDLSDKSVSMIQGLSDKTIDAVVKTYGKIKAIPEAGAERVKGVIDRRIVRVSKTDPVKAQEAILDLYKRGVVPGVKKKKKTIANINAIDEAVKRTVPVLAKKYDVEDLEDFANVISAEKKEIFSNIEKGLVDAGEKGRMISTKPIVEQLDILMNSDRAKLSNELKRSIQRAKDDLVDTNEDGSIQIPKEISPSSAQDLIADLNAQLQAYYRGAGKNSDVIVDTLVVNILRKSVDDMVDDLGDGSFKELKAKYSDLKKMEDDVVHRAVFEAQKGNGLADLTDIMSAGDITAGIISPAFFAKGAAQFFTKEVIKSLNDKDELIRQMFLYGKNIDAQ